MKKLIIISIIWLIGCSEVGYDPTYITQNCSVTTTDNNAIIKCPDGTQVILPPNTIIQLVEVPVLVEKPGCHYDNGHHNGDNHDNESHHD